MDHPIVFVAGKAVRKNKKKVKYTQAPVALRIKDSSQGITATLLVVTLILPNEKGKAIEKTPVKYSPTKVQFSPTFRTIGKKAQTIYKDDSGLEDGLVRSCILSGCILPVGLRTRAAMKVINQDLEQMNSIYHVWVNYRVTMEAHIKDLESFEATRAKLKERDGTFDALTLQVSEWDQTIADLEAHLPTLEDNLKECNARNEKLFAFAKTNGGSSIGWQQYISHQDDFIRWSMDEWIKLYGKGEREGIEAALLCIVG